MSECVWTPSEDVLEQANVVRLMRRHGIADYRELGLRETRRHAQPTHSLAERGRVSGLLLRGLRRRLRCDLHVPESSPCPG